MNATIHRSAGTHNEAGIAMFWVLVAMVVIALTGVTVHRIAIDDSLVSTGFEVETSALLAAEGGIAQYMGTWLPGDDFDMYADSVADTEETGTDDVIDLAMSEFYGADLEERTMSYGVNSVTIDPRKVTESSWGDLWLVEGSARVEDTRNSRPDADRTLRMFARFEPPFEVTAAFNAPNGLDILPGAEHFHVDGKRKSKCGDGDNVAPMYVPEGELTGLANATKQHIKGGDIDSLAQSYQEAMDTLGIDFNKILNFARGGGFSSKLVIPDDFADLEDVDFKTLFPKTKTKSRTWPIVLIEGDEVIDAEVKGHGFLIVTGKLTLNAKLDWKGVVLLGKQLEVFNTHLHAKGVFATGLDCTNAEIVSNQCRNILDGEHLGVKYNQCEAEAAWMQLLILRPFPGARHTRLF